MVRILFVCLGNICRSPMAEFIMKDLAEKAGVADQFVIASAATSSYNVRNGQGAPVYYEAKNILEAHGIRCAGKQAQVLRKSDYQAYDLIIGMDSDNIYDIKLICGGDPDGKVRRLLSYTPHPRDVADPWYTGQFDVAYSDIYTGCQALLRSFIK